MPSISVVMAVHNGLPYLQTAVDSILYQTFVDFEFLIVDDASRDGSPSILKAYVDPRIKLMRHSTQRGLSASLNRALSFARGKYIARMDHDDISLPTRLEEQIEYLESHPKIDIVGTWVETIGIIPRQHWRLPTKNEDIQCEMIFNPTLAHSSIMFRKSTNLGYNTNIKQAQDYDLWYRVSEKVRFANLDRVLLKYRIHSGQVGKKNKFGQLRAADNVRASILRKNGLNPSDAQLKLHHEISRWQFSGNRADLKLIDRWLNILGNLEQIKMTSDRRAWNRSLSKRWVASCRASIKLGLITWKIFRTSELSKAVPLFQQATLWAKCLSRQWGWRNV